MRIAKAHKRSGRRVVGQVGSPMSLSFQKDHEFCESRAKKRQCADSLITLPTSNEINVFEPQPCQRQFRARAANFATQDLQMRAIAKTEWHWVTNLPHST